MHGRRKPQPQPPPRGFHVESLRIDAQQSRSRILDACGATIQGQRFDMILIHVLYGALLRVPQGSRIPGIPVILAADPVDVAETTDVPHTFNLQTIEPEIMDPEVVIGLWNITPIAGAHCGITFDHACAPKQRDPTTLLDVRSGIVPDQQTHSIIALEVMAVLRKIGEQQQRVTRVVKHVGCN